jgi:exodeoxyribonuclease-3
MRYHGVFVTGMKVATYNANSIRKRLDAVIGWLGENEPDVLCVQETKCQDADFPAEALAQTGYHLRYRGMKGYNGVAVLSLREPEEVTYGFDDGRPDPDDVRLIRVVVDGIPIVNTYVPNGYKIDSPKYVYKLKWYRRLRKYFEAHLQPDRPAIWCGDMNVAPEPIDVHSPEKHLKHVCFHEDVRDAYHETVAWGFVDVFRRLYPDVQQFTFWDYLRPSSLEDNKGWRIDHILATPPLAGLCAEVEVDVEARRGPGPSDHTFVWAKFDL